MSFLEEPKVGDTKTIETEYLNELQAMKLHGQYFK